MSNRLICKGGQLYRLDRNKRLVRTSKPSTTVTEPGKPGERGGATEKTPQQIIKAEEKEEEKAKLLQKKKSLQILMESLSPERKPKTRSRRRAAPLPAEDSDESTTELF